MTIRRSLVVGVVLGVAATVLLMLSPLGTVTSEAFDKVSVTRTSDDGTTEVAGTELNVSGATKDDIDRSLIGVATLGAIFLGLAAIIAGVVMISLRF
ncbi:MAG: hypothetical protein R2704_06080 [Microthrixaceae bacterium]